MHIIFAKKFNIISTLSVATILASSFAANAIEVPGAVDAGQVEKRFARPETNLSNPDFALPVVTDAGELSDAAKRKLEQSQFTLQSVTIEGATIYSAEELKFAYQDLIGKKISLLDARGIAKQITDHYRKNGYILSQAVIPAQELNNGVLKVKVVEGYISGFQIEGNISDSQRKVIQSYAEKIISSRPVTNEDMERYLLLMNDLPGAKVSGLLRPAAGQFGAAEIVLSVTDKKFEGAYSVDNRGSKFIGPWQHSLSGSVNSLISGYDQTTLRLSTTNPTTELRSYELSHSQLLGSEGTTLSGRFSQTHTKPGDTLKPVEIVGDSTVYELKVDHPFIRSRSENLVSRFAFEVNNVDTDVFTDVDFTEDRLRMVRLGTYYNIVDDYAGNNIFDLQLTQGLNVFNASTSGTDRSNALGDSAFTKINLEASRLQNIYNNVSMLFAVSSQYSFDPLLVSEQFSLGGADYGRAYDPAELLGDTGVIGKLELRYDDVVGAEYLQDYQLYGFYDLGRVWLRNVPSFVNDKQSLSSAGVGVRSNLTNSVSGGLELAMPLTKKVSTMGDDEKDPRVFVNLLVQF